MIFISPQKVLLAPSGPLRGESALSLVFTVVLVTDVLLQRDHVSGTTYLHASLRDKEVSCTEFRRQLQENIHVSDGLRRIVTFLIIAPYEYCYLLTYTYVVYIIELISVSLCGCDRQELASDPQLFVGGASRLDIQQGDLGEQTCIDRQSINVVLVMYMYTTSPHRDTPCRCIFCCHSKPFEFTPFSKACVIVFQACVSIWCRN